MELHVIDHFYLENVFFNTPENTLTPPRIHMSHPCDHKCGNHMKCFMANMYSCWLLLAVFPISGLDFRFRLSWFSLCFLLFFLFFFHFWELSSQFIFLAVQFFYIFSFLVSFIYLFINYIFIILEMYFLSKMSENIFRHF